MNDGVDDLGWLVLAGLLFIVVVTGLVQTYKWWRWFI